MAKKKKTRKQKALSDLRHNATTPKRDTSSSPKLHEVDDSPRSSMFTYTIGSSTATTGIVAKPLQVTENSYIAHDLRKTAFLTLAIIASQLILYFFINRP